MYLYPCQSSHSTGMLWMRNTSDCVDGFLGMFVLGNFDKNFWVGRIKSINCNAKRL